MLNWGIFKITYADAPSFEIVKTTTDNPCHLTLYWTLNKPLTHKKIIALRGMTLPWGAYFCLNALNAIEQEEGGDTLTHTFICPDWFYCQTRYFVMAGTVEGIVSPSTSAIYERHHPGALPFVNGDFEIWPVPARPPFNWQKDTAGSGFSNWVRETTDVYSGSYAARLEASGRNRWTLLRQEVYADPYRGYTAEFTGWDKCINIAYGQIAYWASGPGSWSQLHRFTFHAGWRLRSYTHYIDPLATKIGISVSLMANSDVLRTIVWDKTNIKIIR
ncbi:hypothetical protein ES705_16734 [subsurface metagenome]